MLEDCIVHIRYLSGLRDATNTGTEEVRFPPGTRLRDLSRWLAEKYGLAVPGPGVMGTVNGRGWSQTPLAMETELHNDDQIALFPLLSGG